MKKQTAIAIDIEVLRDWKQALINTYVKEIGDWEGEISHVENKELWKHFKLPKYIEVKDDEMSQLKLEDGENYEGFVDYKLELDAESEYEINEELFKQFMNDYLLEIFAHAKETEKNVIHFLNEEQKKNRDIKIALYSTMKGKAKPATLFFLAKYGCEIDSIKFITDLHDLVEFDHIINNSSLNKKGFKELDFRNLH